jgi:hypothetical protein
MRWVEPLAAHVSFGIEPFGKSHWSGPSKQEQFPGSHVIQRRQFLMDY